MLLSRGQRVGPYEVLGPLGAGGMGVVYRAHDSRLQRDVALKFLHGQDGDDDAARARLLREARAASALNHPNICAVYDVGEADGRPYIAMELVEGRSINADARADELDTASLVRRIKEVVDALAHAHARGVIHRDLKSANILSDKTGRLKVLDFGLAQRLSPQALEEATRSANSIEGPVIAGTVGWMSPEVLRGAPADARSDLWAVGILVHELASGKLPFRGDTSFEVAGKILSDPPPPLPPRLAPALQQIAARLLEKNPSERYQSAAEVLAALDVAVGSESRIAATSPVRASPWARRAAWTLGAAIVAVLGIWSLSRDSSVALTDQRLVSTMAASVASPALSHDGRRVAFVAADERRIPQVWIQDLAQDQPRAITNGEVAAARPRWTADDHIVFGRRGQGIWIVPALGGTPRRLIDTGSNPNLSNDSRAIVYERANRIWVADIDGANARQLDSIPEKYYNIPAMPAFSPDRRQVVYFRPEAGPNGDFWIAATEGLEPPRRLTFDMREGSAPLWAPSGRIIFSSAREGSRTLWQIPSNGGTAVPLTTGAGEDDEPELSADGSRLLYSNVRNTWRLMVGAPDASPDRQLLERRTEIVFPHFSPDGRRIVFFGRSDRAVAIFRMNVDGTELTQLTGGRELNHMPRWSADGAFIYFFQITPELSFRRVPAVGGPSERISDFVWEKQNYPQFDPSGRRLSYTRAATAGAHPQTIVRDVASGGELTLAAPAIEFARWSPDGRRLVGHRPDGFVVVCTVDTSDCRNVTRGIFPDWSGDGSRILFMSATIDSAGKRELWSTDLEGREPRLVRSIGPFRSIDLFFDVSPDDSIVWGEFRPGLREVWTALVR